MSKRRAALRNLGCRVNEYETEKMARALTERGFEIVPFDGDADVYIVNTCTVTNIADRKSRQMLHRAKKQNPDALVVAAGCYVDIRGDELQKDPLVDLVLTNAQKPDAARIISAMFGKEEGAGAGIVQEMPSGADAFRTRSFLKIQDGCNMYCSYCIIPYARGRIRSVPEEEVLRGAWYHIALALLK